MYYSAIGLIAVLVLLIENWNLFFVRSAAFEASTWKIYRNFLTAVLIYYSTDVLWGVFETLKLPELLFVDTTVYFVTMAVGVMFWTRYATSYLEEKSAFGYFLVCAGRVFCGSVIALVAANLFLPVLFSVNDQCEYVAFPVRYVQLVVQIVLLLMTSVHAFRSMRPSRGEKKRRYRAIALFGLIVALFLIIQLWYPYLPLYTGGYMLGTCILHAVVVREELEEYKLNTIAAESRARETTYARISALAGDYICIYTVDPETGHYLEYSTSKDFDSLLPSTEGDDFFGSAGERNGTIVYPGDVERVRSMLTRESMLSEIEQRGRFSLRYRLVIDGKPIYVQLNAAMVEEREGPRLIIGINDVDASVRQEEEFVRRLIQAQSEANRDALTGVQNRHAYLGAEERLDRQIAKHHPLEFAIVIFDVNGLKEVNDTLGHLAGDQYIRDASKVVSSVFEHSSVFRVGGDEFTVIAQGEDYEHIDELMRKMAAYNEQASERGEVVVACGMAKYDHDPSVAPVFERADLNMYKNKSSLKGEEEEQQANDEDGASL